MHCFSNYLYAFALMSTQQRITITLPTEDNKTVHLRTTTKPEKRQKQIYAALGIKPD